MRLNNSHVINELYQFNYKDINMHALDLDLTSFLNSLENWDDIFYYDNNLYILDFYTTGVNYKVNLETKEIVQLTYTFDSDVLSNGYYQWFDSCGNHILIIESPDYDTYNVHLLTLGEDIIDTPISIISDKGYDIYGIYPDIITTDVYNDDILYLSCIPDEERKLNDIIYKLDTKKGTIESMNINIEEEAKDLPGTFEFAYISHGRLKVVFRIDKYFVFYEYAEALNRFNEIDRIIATYTRYNFTHFKNNHIILNYRLNEYIGILVYDLHTHEKYLTPRMANSLRDVWFIGEDIMADSNNDGHIYRLEKCDKAALNLKADKSELFSGDYNDLATKQYVDALMNIEFNAGERIEKDFAGLINSNLASQSINDYAINLVIGNDYIVDISIDVTDNEGNVTTLNDNRIVSAEAYNAEGSVLLNILDGKIMLIDKALVAYNGKCQYYKNYLAILFNELIQTYGNNIVVKKLDIVEADYRQINSELFSSGDFHLLTNAEKQTIGNVLTKDNTTKYTPADKYNPATKLYVDNSILNARPLYDVSNVVESKDYSDILPINLGEGITYINIPNRINITQGVEYTLEYTKGNSPNSNGGFSYRGSAIATYDENKDCLVLDFGDPTVNMQTMILVDVYYNEEDGTFSKNENNHVYLDSPVPLMGYNYVNKLKLTASDATPVCDEFLKVFKFVTEEEKAKWNNEFVQVDVVDGVLNLTDDKYQKTNMINGTTIVFPTVNRFTEIHLYFDPTENLVINLPACRKKQIPDIVANKSYELVAIYNMNYWLVEINVFE